MQIDEEGEETLVLEFIHEIDDLCTSVKLFQEEINRKIADLSGKSKQLAVYLDEKKKTKKEKMQNNLQNSEEFNTAEDNENLLSDTLELRQQNATGGGGDEEDEAAKVKLAQLMSEDDNDKAVEEQPEQRIKEIKLKSLSVVLNRLNPSNIVNGKLHVEKARGGENEVFKESREIDNLCNIDSYLENITKPKGDKAYKGSPRKRREAAKTSVVSDTEEATSEDSPEPGIINDTHEDAAAAEMLSKKDSEIDVDEMAKAELENMMKDDGSVHEDEDGMSNSSNEGEKKTATKKTSTESAPKAPLLSPLRLNLLKTPPPEEMEQETEPVVKNEAADDEPIKTPKKVKAKLFDSDNEEEAESNKKTITVNEDDRGNSSDSSLPSIKKGKKRNKRNSSSSSVIELDESVELDDKDSDFEEIVKTSSAKKRKVSNLKKLNDSDEDSEAEKEKKEKDDKKKEKESRRNLRKVIDDTKLKDETKNALEAEEERLKRIEKQKQLKAASSKDDDDDLEITHVEGPKVPNMFLDVEKQLLIDPSIAKCLKAHQIKGVKFMWESCYESVEILNKPNNAGGGCVLAHCMGLGKTLQVIALVHTLLANSDLTKTKRVIVLTPINALLNWRHEFQFWLRDCEKKVNVFDISTVKTVKDRLKDLKTWYERGGVFVTGYTMFTNLIKGKTIKKKSIKEEFEKYLMNPGADLVVCDEGHILKNEKTSTAKCVNSVHTRRRVVLTGSPLQNNLMEYHCMVSFVKPNLLGNVKEFRNRFVNPINNGQHADSTHADVQYMKKRAHCLHKTLSGCVQRMDYTVIKPLIPPKREYVISIRLSEVQQKLYTMYLERYGYDKMNADTKLKGVQLFGDYQSLYRIWTHPWLLRVYAVQQQANEAKRELNDFINNEDYEDEDGSYLGEEADNLSDILDDCDEDSNDAKKKGGKLKATEKAAKLQSIDRKIKNDLYVDDDDDDIISLDNDEQPTTSKNGGRTTRSRKQGDGSSDGKSSVDLKDGTDSMVYQWWSDFVTDDMEDNMEQAGKIVLFAEILKRCEEVGDKLLVFSQSLYSLNLIESFLKYWSLTKKGSRWLPLVDYHRIDGTTEVASRKKYINEFNDDDTETRLFLISSKAGGIGINLVGANRVIVFDACWNPVYDIQAIFRVYRFGQKKPVFIYRLLAQGTMEEKIYNRQVIKQSMSLRVIDEHQLDRHFTSQELRELYTFEPDNSKKPGKHKLPQDDLLADVLKSCDKWISKYHEHDSLLENKIEEGLSEQERQAAWDEYEQEKKGRSLPAFNHDLYLQQQHMLQQHEYNAMISAYYNSNPHLHPMNQDFTLDNETQKFLSDLNNQAYMQQHRLQQQLQQQQQQQQQRVLATAQPPNRTGSSLAQVLNNQPNGLNYTNTPTNDPQQLSKTLVPKAKKHSTTSSHRNGTQNK